MNTLAVVAVVPAPPQPLLRRFASFTHLSLSIISPVGHARFVVPTTPALTRTRTRTLSLSLSFPVSRDLLPVSV